MIKNPRNLLWILPLCAFATSPLWQPPVAAFLTPRGGYNPKLAQLDEQSPAQNFILDTVSITLTNEGKEEWQIDADRAYTGENDHEIEMEGVSALYIGKEKEPTSITSRKGKYLINTRHLTLIEQVVVSKPTRDQHMYSELIQYDDNTKVVVSPGKVNLRAPNLKLTAGRMDYDMSSDAYEFSDRVKVDL